MTKADLKKTAFMLAMSELTARLAYEKNVEGGQEEKRLKECEEKVASLRMEATNIRSQIPELADKTYWWDIPFDVQKVMEESSDTLAFPEGGYIEQDDFDTDAPFEVGKVVNRYRGGDALSLFLSNVSDDKVILYANRKELKQHVMDWIDIKEIVAFDMYDNGQSVLGASRSSYYWEQSRLEREISSAEARLRANDVYLQSEQSEFESRWDMRERFRHSSMWTNEERWFRGEMSTDDYLREGIWRDYESSQMANKRNEEAARIRHQIEQKKRQLVELQAQKVKDIIASSDRGSILRFMRCGEVFYYQGEIMAITMFKKPVPVYEGRYKGYGMPETIHGEIRNCHGMLRRKPSPLPFMEFVLDHYGHLIKPYNVLASRPQGASDELWRAWAELRFTCQLLLDNEKGGTT